MLWTGWSAVPVAATDELPQVPCSHRVTTPAVLTDAQNAAVGQSTLYWPPVGLVGAGPAGTGLDHEVPSQVTASWPSMATQKVGVGQETAFSDPPGEAGRGGDQVRPFQVVAPPWSSTATQAASVGHDTPKMAGRPEGLAGAGRTGADQVPGGAADPVDPPQAPARAPAATRATAPIRVGAEVQIRVAMQPQILRPGRRSGPDLPGRPPRATAAPGYTRL